MATTPNSRVQGAHYHPVKATAKWAEFIAGTQAAVTGSINKRARRAEQRKQKTTYAKGTTGGN